MSPSTFITLTSVLLGGALLALVVAFAFALSAVVGWRTVHRKRRLTTCLLFLACVPLFLATQRANWELIFRPSLEQQVPFVERSATSAAALPYLEHSPVILGDRAVKTLSGLLGGGALLTSIVACAFLAAGVVGWNTPKRRTRLLKFSCFLVAAPILLGLHQAVFWGVLRPPLARKFEAMVQKQQLEIQNSRKRQADLASLATIGEAAPSFRINIADGSEFTFDELRGRIVLLNFFATWCGPCHLELPHLQELWDQYGNREDFALLAIGREETTDVLQAFVAKHEYSFPVAADPERRVYSLYAKELIPRTYLIGRDGRIHFATTGLYESELQELREVLARQLSTFEATAQR